MKPVLAFLTTALVLIPLLILTFQLGWSLDATLLDRFTRPEEAYIVIQDESFRTNDREATRLVLRIYSDDTIRLITEVAGTSVTPEVAPGSALEALRNARLLGLTNLLFTNIEDCAEPFFGEIRVTSGYFTKRVKYSQCISQDNPTVQDYHRYLFDTFTRKG